MARSAAAAAATSTRAAPAASSFPDLGDNGGDDEGTTWMQPMARSWEEIQEDASGGLSATNSLQLQLERKRALQAAADASGGGGGGGGAAGQGGVIEKGVIRYLFVILDFSWHSGQNDLKPTRRGLTLELMELFIREFFDQNPLSHLGLIAVSHGLATLVSPLSGSPEAQIQAMRDVHDQGGEFGMQNALEMAKDKLSQIPPYGSREVLVLLSSLSTVDPGDLHDTISGCHAAHMTCSVIALAAEMYVATLLASTTGGSCNVVLNRAHYQSLLMSHIPPLPAHKVSARQKAARKWIHMGFPEQKYETYPSLCSCHEDLRYGGYSCPKCHSKLCELPSECKVCGLTLVSSPHLARSYHHLFPVPVFRIWGTADDTTAAAAAAAASSRGATAAAVSASSASSSAASSTLAADSLRVIVSASESSADISCRSCCRSLPVATHLRLQCPKCACLFCIECDDYIHTILHNCPGCLSTTDTLDESNKAEEKKTSAQDSKMQEAS